ncbi:hypothetical protein [Agriterribacter sp.]|uniref:hypothetical protein n=1 Tax=Agriterribacter sp. TaxID=2821509 RepID=UPI002B6E416F|nr:hypothetical protein [Agriterribacter sp.]HRO48292.1 hypothetical protein [Agriterribacter sp.]HRQ17149.1 hypothetical protein [Agriterribacter sp.]
MKKDNSINERYHKSYHFLNKAVDDPFLCLTAIFDAFHPNDFRKEITFWQQLALANDQSAYDEGKVREDMMDFCRELLRITEAFYIINENRKRQQKAKKRKNSKKETGRIINAFHQLTLLSDREKADPQLAVRAFCNAFSHEYSRIELLDLLDAVITYEGKKTVYKGNLVLVYQCMESLLNLAYMIAKKKKLLNHLKPSRYAEHRVHQ